MTLTKLAQPATARHWPLLLAASLLICWPASAQDSKAVSREREALRRAQSALQQVQQQRDALQTEKATLERNQAEQAALAKRQQAKLNAALLDARRLRTLESARATLQLQLDSERQALATQRESAAAELARAAARLDDAQRQILQLRTERGGANRALVARLEAATQALAEAIERNRLLHAIGQQAAERLGGLSSTDKLLQRDPVLGLTSVRLRSEAEDLLQRLDAQRQPGAAPQP